MTVSSTDAQAALTDAECERLVEARQGNFDPLQPRDRLGRWRDVAHFVHSLKLPGVHLVGGAVRDAQLGKPHKDADFIVLGKDTDEIRAALVPHGRVEDLVVAERPVGVRLYPHDEHARELAPDGIEFVPPRTERSTGAGHKDFEIVADKSVGFEEDALRRDFTINAMAQSLEDGKLLDPLGGAQDAHAKTLRVVGPNTFAEDPLRIVRGLRFISQHDLTPDPQTLALMHEYAPQIAHLSGERIGQEMDKLLMGKHPAKALRIARDTGALAYLFPELEPTIGFNQQSQYHGLDADEHIFEVVQALADHGANLNVRWAGLFHDSGKPESAWEGPSGRLHYYENEELGKRAHEEIGAEKAKRALKRMSHLTTEDRGRVVDIVKAHMFRDHDKPEPVRARKFLDKHGEALALDLLDMKYGDISGKESDRDERVTHELLKLDTFEAVLKEQLATGQPYRVKDLAITGHDLLGLGLKPGPIVGETLGWLKRQVIADPSLNTPEWLRAEAERYQRRVAKAARAGEKSDPGLALTEVAMEQFTPRYDEWLHPRDRTGRWRDKPSLPKVPHLRLVPTPVEETPKPKPKTRAKAKEAKPSTALLQSRSRLAPEEVAARRETLVPAPLDLSQAPEVRAVVDQEWESSRHKKDPAKTRAGSGFPAHVATKEEFEELVKDIDRRLHEGYPYSTDWYADSGNSIRAYSHGNVAQADMIAQLFAIYSPQKPVAENLAMAFRVYEEYRLGHEPRHGSADQRRQSLIALKGGYFLEGVDPAKLPKVRRFYANILKHIDHDRMLSRGFDGREVTGDGWMGAAWGWGENTGAGALSRFEIEHIERITQALADHHGIEPEQAQAAIWTSIKAERYEPTSKVYADESTREAALSQAGESFADSLFRPQYTVRLPFEALTDAKPWTAQLSTEHAQLYTAETGDTVVDALRSEGFVTRQTDGGFGFFLNDNGDVEINPATAAEIAIGDLKVTDKGSAPEPSLYYNVVDEQRGLYDGLSATIAQELQQAAGGWHRRMSIKNRSPADATMWRVFTKDADGNPRLPTNEEMQQVATQLDGGRFHATQHHDGFTIAMNDPDPVLERAVELKEHLKAKRKEEAKATRKLHVDGLKEREGHVEGVIDAVFGEGIEYAPLAHRGNLSFADGYQAAAARAGRPDLLGRVGGRISSGQSAVDKRWEADPEAAAADYLRRREHLQIGNFGLAGKQHGRQTGDLLEAKITKEWKERLHPRDREGKFRKSAMRALRRLVPHRGPPEQEPGDARGRYVWLRGRRVFVPRDQGFERLLDNIRFTSPAGGTNIYRNGALIQIEGQPSPPGHGDLNPPGVGPRDGGTTPKMDTGEKFDFGLAAPAKQLSPEAADAALAAMQASENARVGLAERIIAGEQPPILPGTPRAVAEDVLQALGFSVPEGLGMDRVEVDGGGFARWAAWEHPSRAMVEVYSDLDTGRVTVSRFERGYRPIVPPEPLGRAPETWDEFADELRGLAYRLADEHGQTPMIGDVDYVSAEDNRTIPAHRTLGDHAGSHNSLNGRIRLGEETIHALARGRADAHWRESAHGPPPVLDGGTLRSEYASYKVGVHEALHAAGPVITTNEYAHPVFKGIEEMLVEELAHVETVKLLRAHGQTDVLAWVRRNPNDWKTQGTYQAYRARMDKILTVAGIPAELREERMRELKFETSPGRARVDKLVEWVTANPKGFTDAEDARRWVSKVMGEPSEADAFEFRPQLVSDLADFPDEEGVTLNGKRILPGSVVKVDWARRREWRDAKGKLRSKEEKVQLDATVLAVKESRVPGFKYALDVRWHDNGTVSHNVMDVSVADVAVEAPPSGEPVELMDGLSVASGDLIRYDGRADGGMSEARVTRARRLPMTMSTRSPEWEIEAVTTDDSLKPGTHVILTYDRVGNRIEVAGRAARAPDPVPVAEPEPVLDVRRRRARARAAVMGLAHDDARDDLARLEDVIHDDSVDPSDRARALEAVRLALHQRELSRAAEHGDTDLLDSSALIYTESQAQLATMGAMDKPDPGTGFGPLPHEAPKFKLIGDATYETPDGRVTMYRIPGLRPPAWNVEWTTDFAYAMAGHENADLSTLSTNLVDGVASKKVAQTEFAENWPTIRDRIAKLEADLALSGEKGDPGTPPETVDRPHPLTTITRRVDPAHLSAYQLRVEAKDAEHRRDSLREFDRDGVLMPVETDEARERSAEADAAALAAAAAEDTAGGRVYRVNAEQRSKLDAQIAKLSKSAAKLGLAEPTVTEVGDEWVEHREPHVPEGRGERSHYLYVQVKGEEPKIAGWEFLASLQNVEGANVIKRVPGSDEAISLDHFRHAEPLCDYCKTKRDRKMTYVVHNDAEGVKRVGSSCIRDFLGHGDPATIAAYMEQWQALEGFVGGDDEDGEEGGGRVKRYVPTEEYLTHVATMLRTTGWVPRSAGGLATADAAGQNYRAWRDQETDKSGRPMWEEPTEDDMQRAKAALEWARTTLAEKPNKSEFDHNMVTYAKAENLADKAEGILAYVVVAHSREIEREIEQRRKAAVTADSKHVGAVGDRMDVRARVESIYERAGDYGTTYITKLVDEDGNVFKWFGSYELDRDKVYDGKFSIKKHDEYKGVKETVLTRPSGLVEYDPDAPPPVEKPTKKGQRVTVTVDANGENATGEIEKAQKGFDVYLDGVLYAEGVRTWQKAQEELAFAHIDAKQRRERQAYLLAGAPEGEGIEARYGYDNPHTTYRVASAAGYVQPGDLVAVRRRDDSDPAYIKGEYLLAKPPQDNAKELIWLPAVMIQLPEEQQARHRSMTEHVGVVMPDGEGKWLPESEVLTKPQAVAGEKLDPGTPSLPTGAAINAEVQREGMTSRQSMAALAATKALRAAGLKRDEFSVTTTREKTGDAFARISLKSRGAREKVNERRDYLEGLGFDLLDVDGQVMAIGRFRYSDFRSEAAAPEPLRALPDEQAAQLSDSELLERQQASLERILDLPSADAPEYREAQAINRQARAELVKRGVSWDDYGEAAEKSDPGHQEVFARYGVRVVAPIPGPDTAIHSTGGFGPAEVLRDQLPAGRQEGHFGTGFYFLGTPEAMSPSYREGARGRAVVGLDLTGLNLFRPRDDNQAFKLHDALRDLNDLAFLGKQKATVGQSFQREISMDDVRSKLSRILGEDVPLHEVSRAWGRMAEAVKRAERSHDWDEAGRTELASSALMKSLGYDGVDVRGLERIDNTGYGSVLFADPTESGEKGDPGDYRGQHTAPTVEDTATMDDVAQDIFPADFYTLDTATQARYYGHAGGPGGPDPEMWRIDLDALSKVNQVRGQPDAEITVYRGVPPEVTEINPGDWVTQTKAYAERHAASEEGWHVIEQKVRVGDLYTDGNSIHEWGWQPNAGEKLDPGTAEPHGWQTQTWFHVTTPENAARARDVGLHPRDQLAPTGGTFERSAVDQGSVYLWPTQRSAEEWKEYVKGRGIEGMTETLPVFSPEPSRLGPDHEVFGMLVLRPFLRARSGYPITPQRLPSGEHESDYFGLLDSVGYYDTTGLPEWRSLRQWLESRPDAAYRDEAHPEGAFWSARSPSDNPPEWAQEGRGEFTAGIKLLEEMPPTLRTALAAEFSARGRPVQHYGPIHPHALIPFEEGEKLDPGEVWRVPLAEYAPKPDYERDVFDAYIRGDVSEELKDEIGEAFAAQRQREKRWEAAMQRALSLGEITVADASALGYWPSGHETANEYVKGTGWGPLPQALWHVTTAASAVRAQGLKSRRELSQDRGAGLGGGDDETISFTTDPQVAADIERGLRAMRATVRGEFTVQQMIDAAEKGTDAESPWLRDWMRGYGARDWERGQPFPREVEDALSGLKRGNISTVMGTSEPEMIAGLSAGTEFQPASTGWYLEPGQKPIIPGAERPTYVGYQFVRPLTEQEKAETAADLLRTWMAWREQHGGPSDPVFFSANLLGLANVPSEEIETLRVRPRPGAQGYPMGGMMEWRTNTGDAVEVAEAAPWSVAAEKADPGSADVDGDWLAEYRARPARSRGRTRESDIAGYMARLRDPALSKADRARYSARVLEIRGEHEKAAAMRARLGELEAGEKLDPGTPTISAPFDPAAVGLNRDNDNEAVKHGRWTDQVQRATGQLIRGNPISPDDPRIPETLYHATTNLPAVQADGYLRARGAGGLGGDKQDRIVSLTTDPGVANQIAADLHLLGTLGRLGRAPETHYVGEGEWDYGDRPAWGKRVRGFLRDEARRQGFDYGGDPPMRPGDSPEQVERDRRFWEQMERSADLGGWLGEWFSVRQSRTGIQNPIIFNMDEVAAGVDPDKVGIVEVPRASLDNGAVITDFDLSRGHGLSEIRAYGDVAVAPGGRRIEAPALVGQLS